MKKQKIVVTGICGYIGSALAELLSGESRYKDIICIDNRFISERVTQLRDWGIQFVHGSILDKDLMQKHLHDADVVYHLAGITSVAYTSTESDPVQDELIRSTGIDGTNNILDTIPTTCKVIFPSTHVVFEGLTETTFSIPESFCTQPRLTYAQGKEQSEDDIRHLHNYIIVRLGSVYGYSGDTMRINIMPNLFSKIASQDGTISLYGGGVQYKSLVNIHDVVRAIKFLADGDYTGTYHVTNENMTVRQVAEICKEVNPRVTLQDTSDEIPNLGYTLSNQKLLDTGFKFLYNIKDSIREMITKWSSHVMPTDLEYIDKGCNEYIDNRGIIRNYELTEPVNLIGYIESVKGSVRANHYHPIQEQKCLLVSGRYISVTQDLAYPNTPIEYKVIKPGDIAIIQPNVAHTMVFLQDSVFLNLVRGEREHANYGITHTIPYTLVTDAMKNNILDMFGIDYKTECRVCGSKNLTQVLSLGESPLANNLLDSPTDYCATYPLDWMYCKECYNIQLSVVVPAEKMFDNYLYVSSTSPVFRQHFEQAAEQYIQQFNLDEHSVVWDIGSNDGVFLKPLQDRGIRVCGIEPAGNLAQLANSNDIPTIHGYFNQNTASEAYHKVGSPDIVTASNVFAHADDLKSITQTVFNNLKEGGVFIIEVQYLMDTIRDMTFDNIYHEHVNYWSITALAKFFDILGLCMFHVEHIDTHGGSIRCYIKRGTDEEHSTVQEFIEQEGILGVHSADTFREFAKRVQVIKGNVLRNMATLRHVFPHIAAYGSPAKATTALNYFGITGDDIKYTIEDNSMKVGKYLPGTGILIVSPGNYATGVMIVLAWNFFSSIVSKIQSHIPCVSIKDLQLDNISFTKLLSDRYTQPTQIGTMNRYIVDTKDFAFKLVVGKYWHDQYGYGPVEVIPNCYSSMLELVKKISKDRYIVDIGANCGILSVPCAIMGYKVLAFDPVLANVESLELAAAQNMVQDKLSVFQYAISDSTGQGIVYVPACPDNAAMDKDTATAKMDTGNYTPETVRTISFDDWLVPGYQNIGLIKIDVQGHELQVIRGMQKFLSGARDIYILCEFDDSLGEQTGEIQSILTTCGFTELPAITNEDRLFHKV